MFARQYPIKQSSWGQHGAHLGPVGPRWAPCWPHEPCYRDPCETTHVLLVKLMIASKMHGLPLLQKARPAEHMITSWQIQGRNKNLWYIVWIIDCMTSYLHISWLNCVLVRWDLVTDIFNYIIWDWMSNHIPLFYDDVISYPYYNLDAGLANLYQMVWIHVANQARLDKDSSRSFMANSEKNILSKFQSNGSIFLRTLKQHCIVCAAFTTKDILRVL